MIDTLTKRDTFPASILQNLHQTSSSKVGTEESSAGNKSEKISVVSTADTVIEPNAMMILGLDAIVAQSTVVSTRWTPDVTGSAVPNRDFHSSGRLVCGSDEVPIGSRGPESKRVVIFGRGESVDISRKNLSLELAWE